MSNMHSLPTLMDKKSLVDILNQDDDEEMMMKKDHELMELDLGFNKLFLIPLLSGFTSLTKLSLCGNVIERIQSLDCLLNLKWLDLSFNRIKKIECMESLRNLEVLNLSNNRISVIENMDALENLSHFAISNNLISQLDNVLYLRRFKKLFKIYLTENPVSEEDEHIMFIAAFLPKLMGLDEIILDKKIKDEASEKYKIPLKKMRQEELQKEQADAAQDAFVESLNGSCLFKSMLEDDSEAATISCIPGMASLLQTYENQMVELCVSLFNTGMTEHKRRETELNSHFSAQNEIQTFCKQKGSQIRAEFDERYREWRIKLMQMTDPDLIEVEINRCNDEIDKLVKCLIELQHQLIGNLEDNTNILDTHITDMVDDFCKTAQGIFEKCRDLENDYHQKVQEIVDATLEKVAQENLHMPDDVIMLFKDRSILNALAISHGNHLLSINDQEHQLRTRATSWKVALIKETAEKEALWNCTQLSDILKYEDYLRENLRYFDDIQ